MRTILRKHNLLAAAGMALSMAAACPAQTDTSKSPSLLGVLVSRVKPDMIQEFENLSKNELNPALKKAGVPFRQVWTTATFGNLYEYVSVSPIDKFADFDGTPALDRALGKDAAATLLAKFRRCVGDSRRSAIRFRPDLSIVKDSVTPTMAVITTVHAAVGKGPDFESWLKNDLVPGLRKSEIDGYWVHQTVFGGDVGEWTNLTLVRNYADLDGEGPLIRALGRENAAKIIAKSSPFIVSVERSIARTRPDLSYDTTQTKAGSK
jgi:hypothetical protein